MTWDDIGPLKTTGAALLGAVASQIAQGTPIPTSVSGWITLVAIAAGAAGLLHTTAPRNEGVVAAAAASAKPSL